MSIKLISVDAVNLLHLSFQKREKKLKKDKRIGHVTTHETSAPHDMAVLNQLRTTNFKWQRGRQLGKWLCYEVMSTHVDQPVLSTGKGRFGQVFECFNLDTGEINAVKQV